MRARLNTVGVPLFYNTTVGNVTTSAEGATLALSTGQTLAADIVIAADGWHSALREHVAPDTLTALEVVAEEQGSASASTENVLHLTFTVPINTLAQDDELSFLTDRTLVSVIFVLKMLCTPIYAYLLCSGPCGWGKGMPSI